LWKERVLGLAGRICMIKTIMSSLPIYFMPIFLMPKRYNKTD
jgi:hypothetical protein